MTRSVTKGSFYNLEMKNCLWVGFEYPSRMPWCFNLQLVYRVRLGLERQLFDRLAT